MAAYGHLSFITGPMFSGKSTELLKRIHWAKGGERRKILVLKPAMDVRYHETRIISHAGHDLEDVESLPIDRWPEIPAEVEEVFIDEVQFLVQPYFEGDLIQEVQTLLRRGVRVTAAGLDMDTQGCPFAQSAALLAMADDAVKFRSICSVCGEGATHSYRRDPGGPRIALGSDDLYEARCTRHFEPHAVP